MNDTKPTRIPVPLPVSLEGISPEAIEISAGAWCHPTTEHLVMIPELCAEFGRRVQTLIDAARRDAAAIEARERAAFEAARETVAVENDVIRAYRWTRFADWLVSRGNEIK